MSNQDGLTVRQAAVIAGLGYMLNPVPFAEFSIYPKLIVAGHIDQTVANISSHPGLFLTAIFCYLINFIGDIVITWALYFLFRPVNRAVSLLAAWFRLVYTAAGVVAMFNLVTVYRMLLKPAEYLALFGSDQLNAQINLLLHSFRYGWPFSLLIFTLHLFVIAALVWRSGYIPKIFAIILVVDGLCLLIYELQPYFWPQTNLGFLFILTFGELVFGFWLLVMGWRIRDPAALTA